MTRLSIRTRPVVGLLVLALSGSMVMIPEAPADAADTSTRWDSISESPGCGDPYTRTPFATKKGALTDSEAILGPFGTYFGRSFSEVREHLRYWTVPNSGGTRVRVHETMLPALREVTAGLAVHAAQGRVYPVSSAGAFVTRTIGGRYQISRHALGLAIDLNPAQNPFRGDNTLIANMPGWFVKTWEDAGFCWGGRWVGSKDPMHFSWMGPRATASTDDALAPLPPRTVQTNFSSRERFETEFSGLTSRYLLDLADANSNGANDVIGVRPHQGGSVIDVASSTRGFGHCSIFRWFVPDTGIASAAHIVFADVDGDSGQDLIALKPSGDTLRATVVTRGQRFDDVVSSDTGIRADSVAIAAADFDGDHISDLWAATPDGTIAIWAGPDFSNRLTESEIPDGTPSSIAAGDRDGGDTPELFALFDSGTGSRIDVLGFEGAWAPETSFPVSSPPSVVEDIGAGDYDGDGRADAQILRSDGSLEVFIGNTTTGVPPSRWFLDSERGCDDLISLDFAGTFMDDENSTFVVNIESIASTGVTKGCNPPFNDRFCPGAEVTRGQMAAFLVRALGLEADTGRVFTDVPAGSTFAADIARLAAAGITKGCNPPANDRFCPSDRVTREQMAAFLVRSLSLVTDTHAGFDDVPAGSTFAGDIGKLASAGITRGCNPPDNDRFCPREAVTRGQMAAFLDRAGLGG